MQTLRASSKTTNSIRDDLSEYSNPSNWGDKPGPLSFGDYRLVPEGLQARRTVGEAVLRAEEERQREERAEACANKCSCLRPHTALMIQQVFRRPQTEKLMFTWAEVSSIILPPTEEKGLYLLCVETYKSRDGNREFLLQAGSLRGRARWGIEMMVAILRDRLNPPQDGCYGPPRERTQVSLSLFMDMARIACELARFQPSPEGLECLIEALDMLEGRKPGSASAKKGKKENNIRDDVSEYSNVSSGSKQSKQTALSRHTSFSNLSRGRLNERRPSTTTQISDSEVSTSTEYRSGTEYRSAPLPPARITEAALLPAQGPAPHFPVAALRRFGDAARRAAADLADWGRWRELCLLLRAPPGWDKDLWTDKFLPFLWPRDPSLRVLSAAAYPATVDHQLASAAERWRRTLS